MKAAPDTTEAIPDVLRVGDLPFGHLATLLAAHSLRLKRVDDGARVGVGGFSRKAVQSRLVV